MIFVKPKVEKFMDSNPFTKIERISRVCAKSENNITGSEEDAMDWVKGLVSKGHFSITGHYDIIICFDNMLAGECTYEKLQVLKHMNNYIRRDDKNNLRGNLQAWRDWFSCAISWLAVSEESSHYPLTMMATICRDLYNQLTPFFADLTEPEIIESLSCFREKIIIKESDDYLTLKITTDRGITHEIVRHRVFAFMQESTRYCNYTKEEKFGTDLTFISPEPFAWAPYLENAFDYPISNQYPELMVGEEKLIYRAQQVHNVLKASEQGYFNFMKTTAEKNDMPSPSEARCMLTNLLKAEIFVTGTIPQWQSMMVLRDDDAAHKQYRHLTPSIKMFMKEVMNQAADLGA